MLIYKDQIEALSKLGNTPKKIAEISGIKYATVWSYCKRLNLPMEGSGGKNAIIQYNPFESWDENAQYWFGYIAGDGNLSSKKYSISICSQDLEHLTKYKDWLKLDKMHISKRGKSPRGIVLFGNKDTHKCLIDRGLTPNKSLTLELNIPFTPHILRGLFDADGCARNKRNRSKITSGSIKLLQQIQTYLIEHTINSFIAVQCGKTYCISISGHSDKDFYNLLYKDASVYLERKEEKLRRASMRK